MSRAGVRQIGIYGRPEGIRRPPALSARAAVTLWAAVLGVLLPTAQAAADAVKLRGFWIEGVSVERITDGRLFYAGRSGLEMSRPVQEVEGLKLTGYPALDRAEEAEARGDVRGALAAWKQAAARAREPWLIDWIRFKISIAYDRLGEPLEASEAYLELLRAEAPAAYLDRPPIASLVEADDRTKRVIREMVVMAWPSGRGTPTGALARFVDALGPWEDTAFAGIVTEGRPTGDSAVPAPDGAAVDVDKPGSRRPPNQPIETELTTPQGARLVMPRSLNAADPVARLLEQRRYQEAMDALDRARKSGVPRLDLWHYQRGVALLGLSQVRGDQELALEAGLSFMRVVSHFPRSAYAGPSLVEVGYVHEQIGRPDMAERLYDRATALIHKDDDPVYAARLAQLMAGVGE